MADGVLLGCREFGGGTGRVTHNKNRIIAESTFTAEVPGNTALPVPFGDQRQRVSGMADTGEHADKCGATVVLVDQSLKQ